MEIGGWLPDLLEALLPRLTSVLSFLMWLSAKVRARFEELGVSQEGLLDAYIALIPKADGDATLLG